MSLKSLKLKMLRIIENEEKQHKVLNAKAIRRFHHVLILGSYSEIKELEEEYKEDIKEYNKEKKQEDREYRKARKDFEKIISDIETKQLRNIQLIRRPTKLTREERVRNRYKKLKNQVLNYFSGKIPERISKKNGAIH